MEREPDIQPLPIAKRVIGQRYEVVGKIRHIRFQSDDGLFVVANLMPERGRSITVRGNMPGLQTHDRIKARGRWERSKYGDQLAVDFYEPVLPVTRKGIAKFLASQLKGVGPKLAQRIVDTFGEDTVELIDQDPNRLAKVEGIGAKTLEQIKQAWQESHGQRTTLLFLQSHGVTPGWASRIMRRYGSETGHVVRNEPYRLAREVRGIGFATADRIAREIGIPADSPDRVAAGVQHALYEAEGAWGHCFLEQEQLMQAAGKLLQVEAVAIESAIARLTEAGELIIEPHPQGAAIYDHRVWEAEQQVAEEIARLLEAQDDQPPTDSSGKKVEPDELVRALEATLSLDLAGQQRIAAKAALGGKMLVVTGGPGTGKTTLIRIIVAACDKLGWDVHLAAPTGRAAKRMSEATGKEAKTIHRLLEYSFQDGGFVRTADNPLEQGVYVIDESSMIDIYLMRALMLAMPSEARVILVGDVDQLPSVGPGTVLNDFIEGAVVPVVRLDTVFRQAEASLIVRNAHRINRGELPVLPDVEGGEPVDYFAITVKSPEEAEKLIVQLVTQRLPKAFGFDPMQDIQVLCPMRVRQAGAESLNIALQAALNPDGQSIGRGNNPLRIGDRVMQLRNDYDRDVYNGDVGLVIGYSKKQKKALIEFDDRKIEFPAENFDDLSLAYACTVHKAQGSEYPAIVVPLLKTHYPLLQRNLVYTALTRARRLAVFVGDPAAMRIAVGNARPSRRNTRLAERMRLALA